MLSLYEKKITPLQDNIKSYTSHIKQKENYHKQMF